MIKNLHAIAGDLKGVGSISGSRRSPGGGHGNPLQYSCLEDPMDNGDCGATKSEIRERHKSKLN